MSGLLKQKHEKALSIVDLPVENIVIPISIFDQSEFNRTQARYCNEFSLARISRDKVSGKRKDVYNHRSVSKDIIPVTYLKRGIRHAILKVLDYRLAVFIATVLSPWSPCIFAVVCLLIDGTEFLPVMLSIFAAFASFIMLSSIISFESNLLQKQAENDRKEIKGDYDKAVKLDLNGELLEYRDCDIGKAGQVARRSAARIITLEKAFNALTGKKGILKRSHASAVCFERNQDMFADVAVGLSLYIILITAAIVLHICRSSDAYAVASICLISFAGVVFVLPLLFIDTVWEHIKIWGPEISDTNKSECEFYVIDDNSQGIIGVEETSEVRRISSQSGNDQARHENNDCPRFSAIMSDLNSWFVKHLSISRWLTNITVSDHCICSDTAIA